MNVRVFVGKPHDGASPDGEGSGKNTPPRWAMSRTAVTGSSSAKSPRRYTTAGTGWTFAEVGPAPGYLEAQRLWGPRRSESVPSMTPASWPTRGGRDARSGNQRQDEECACKSKNVQELLTAAIQGSADSCVKPCSEP